MIPEYTAGGSYDLPAYDLKSQGTPIAVLTGENTCSAGEAVTIAFRGMNNVKSFGQETAGRSTGVTTFPLSDGRLMGITTSVMADRAGHVYGGSIQPDFPMGGNFDHIFDGKPLEDKKYNPAEDKTIQSAMQWIQDPQGFTNEQSFKKTPPAIFFTVP